MLWSVYARGTRRSQSCKQLGTFLGLLAVRQLRVASGGFGRADEAGKVVNIVQTVRPRFIVGLGSGVAELGNLVGKQAGGDAHFVQVGVS